MLEEKTGILIKRIPEDVSRTAMVLKIISPKYIQVDEILNECIRQIEFWNWSFTMTKEQLDLILGALILFGNAEMRMFEGKPEFKSN